MIYWGYFFIRKNIEATLWLTWCVLNQQEGCNMKH